MSKYLKREFLGLNISLNKITELIDLTVPEGVDLWLTDAIKYMIGFDDDNEWLEGAHDGERPVEFLPAGGIPIHLDEVSTTNNLSPSKSRNIKNSNLLFQYCQERLDSIFLIQYDNPMFVDFREGVINQLELRLKLQWVWGNGE